MPLLVLGARRITRSRAKRAIPLIVVLTLLSWRLVPRECTPVCLDRIRWALGCDDIESLEHLLNRDDEERKDQGYYNRLLDTGLGAEASQAICRGVPELREVVLVSNLSIVRAKGTTWRTNELGMRDRSYSVSKPKGTLRIAMAGDSIGVALGVSEGLGFEPALECWLDDQSRRRGGSRVELLNFSVPGRSPGQRWDHFQKIGWPMNPDIVIFEATAADIGWDAQRLADLLPRGIGWDTPLYGDVLKRLTPMASATSESYAQALRPYRWDLLGAVYQAVAADCRAHGVPCVWMLIPRVGRAVEPAQKARLLDLARAAEFTAIVDVSDAFDGYDPARLAIHPSDFHPDAAGHALLARRLARELAPLPVLDRIRQPPGTHVENARRDDRRGNHAS